MGKIIALTAIVALGLSAAPASAKPLIPKPIKFPKLMPMPVTNPGWGFSAVGLGLAIGAIAVEQASCVHYEPVYNDYGNYIGHHAANVCY